MACGCSLQTSTDPQTRHTPHSSSPNLPRKLLLLPSTQRWGFLPQTSPVCLADQGIRIQRFAQFWWNCAINFINLSKAGISICSSSSFLLHQHQLLQCVLPYKTLSVGFWCPQVPFSSPLLPDEHLWEADGTDNPEYISWVHVEKLPSCWFFGTVPRGIHGWWETQMLPENSRKGNSPGVSGGVGKAAAAVGFVGRCPSGTSAGNASWTEFTCSCLNQSFLRLLFTGLCGCCLVFSEWRGRGSFWSDMAWQREETSMKGAGSCCFCLQTSHPCTLRGCSDRYVCSIVSIQDMHKRVFISARGIICTLVTAELCQSGCTGRLCRRPAMQVRGGYQQHPTPHCVLQQHQQPSELQQRDPWHKSPPLASSSAPFWQEKWSSNLWLCLGSSLVYTGRI